jgi:glycosyltransferase involved in cell wall biosynthesis
MKVSVVIPSLYKVDGEYLKLCVASLRATTDWDIIVVTNGTKTNEPINIPGATLRLHTSDQGQCIATNIGAKAVSSDTDYIMVSNSDMYYAPGWNKNLHFDHPGFSPNLVEPTNNPGSAAPFVKFDGGFTLDEFKRDEVDKFVHRGVGIHVKGELFTDEPGFNLPFFIRKDLWDFLGGYDVAYDPWGSNSDTDLQTRINLAGVTPMRLRDVLVYHFSNKSGTFDGTHQDFYQNNIEYFHSKFGFDRDELGSDVWRNLDMLPNDPKQVKYKQEKYEG